MILENLMEETGASAEVRLLSGCVNGSNECWALTKEWNVWYKVVKLSISVILWLTFSILLVQRLLLKEKKKSIMQYFHFFFSFTTEQKLGYALNASFSFCLLSSCCLLVCICVHRCINFNFDMKLFSFIPEHFLVSYWQQVQELCCSSRPTCTEKLILFCLLVCVPGDHSSPRRPIHRLLHGYKLY